MDDIHPPKGTGKNAVACSEKVVSVSCGDAPL